MQIKTVMRTHFETVPDDLPLPRARALMARAQLRTLPVVRGDHLLGLLHEEDLARAGASTLPALAAYDWSDGLDRMPVAAIMRPDPPTVEVDATVAEAARLLRTRWLDAAPVVDGTALVGLVTVPDLLGVLGDMLQPPRAVGFEHILVAVTFDALGTATVETGTALAREHEARLTLLHAITPPSRSRLAERLPPEPLTRIARQRREDCLAQLATLAPDAPGLDVARLVVTGEPAGAIVAGAARLHADLVIVGESPRRWLGRRVAASVAEAVIARAPCPVLLVRARRVAVNPGDARP